MDRNVGWLELFLYYQDVALRKESVDRNFNTQELKSQKRTSLSARRAWIEMINGLYTMATTGVALRKESVDRNIFKDAGGTEAV